MKNKILILVAASAVLVFTIISCSVFFLVDIPAANQTTVDSDNIKMVGSDRDEHGCIGSAGYSWCEVKQKCLRPWEEACDVKQTVSQEYKNDQYGFSIALPNSWAGYSIVTDNWTGNMIDEPNSPNVNGPKILIRHPLWTAEKPYQDIPVMVFTPSQWNLITQEKMAVSAAPIGPSELGRNANYIFALPARYNYAFPEGFEEVEKIIENKSFKAW